MGKDIKSERVLELFLRALKGESLSPKTLADEYEVSTRSITRDLNTLKIFLSENMDLVGFADLEYSNANHSYTLKMEHFLSNKELLAITKVLIGSRAFSSQDLINIVKKLKANTSFYDKSKLEQLVYKEMYNYSEIATDCESVIDNIWTITECIEKKNYITIDYMRMDRKNVSYKIIPASIMFSEYYFYLIAYKVDSNTPLYFRIDRIKNMTINREHFTTDNAHEFDEGKLRNRSQFMWPGKLRHIRFEFSGPSVQAILDKLPTAKIIDKKNDTYIIDAEVYGNGIKMFLLSQGSWVKVTGPEEFVDEMRDEIKKMGERY